MFESLGEKFEGIVKKLRGHAQLTEANIEEALREVRLALLEADVNYRVVKDFIEAVKPRAIGQSTLSGVNPAQQFIKIVHDELVAMMKGRTEDRPFIVQPGKLNIIMMLGLQGAGKTTFTGKVASLLLKRGCKPLFAACDIYRPAAIEQLKTIGGMLHIPVVERGTNGPVGKIVAAAIEQAKASGRDVVIIDTAGRLHIDEVKMDELIAIRDEFKPDYTFLVADAMTGQDAVNSAKAFNESVGIDGVCLTKMDSDARGGAALSIKAVTGKPIVFVGTGEKPGDLDTFDPEGVASRILGMGDVVGLVRKAQEAIDENDAQDMQSKLAEGSFSYDDFLKQMRTIKKMGSLKGLLSMLPGVGQMLKDIDSDVLEGELKKVESMIQSMTKKERAEPDLLTKERRRMERIAKGSGKQLRDVDQLHKQFNQMRQQMKQVAQMMGGQQNQGMFGRLKGMMGGGGMPGMMPGGMPDMPPGMMGMPGGMPMSNRMKRIQKEYERQQQRELAAKAPRKKKDRKKKR